MFDQKVKGAQKIAAEFSLFRVENEYCILIKDAAENAAAEAGWKSKKHCVANNKNQDLLCKGLHKYKYC